MEILQPKDMAIIESQYENNDTTIVQIVYTRLQDSDLNKIIGKIKSYYSNDLTFSRIGRRGRNYTATVNSKSLFFNTDKTIELRFVFEDEVNKEFETVKGVYAYNIGISNIVKSKLLLDDLMIKYIEGTELKLCVMNDNPVEFNRIRRLYESNSMLVRTLCVDTDGNRLNSKFDEKLESKIKGVDETIQKKLREIEDLESHGDFLKNLIRK